MPVGTAVSVNRRPAGTPRSGSALRRRSPSSQGAAGRVVVHAQCFRRLLSDSAKSRSDAGNSCLGCGHGNRRQRSASSKPSTSSTVASSKPRLTRSAQAARGSFAVAARASARSRSGRSAAERASDVWLGEALSREPRRDGSVAPPALGERAGARPRGPGVVDDARARQRRHRASGQPRLERRGPGASPGGGPWRRHGAPPFGRPARVSPPAGARARMCAGADGRARLQERARSEARPRPAQSASGRRRPPAPPGRGAPAGRPSTSAASPPRFRAMPPKRPSRPSPRPRLRPRRLRSRRPAPLSSPRPPAEAAKTRPRRARALPGRRAGSRR